MNQRTPCASTGEFFNTIRQKLSFRSSELLTRTGHSTAWTYVEIAHARVESIWDGIGDEAA
jgi:hypothetical protein